MTTFKRMQKLAGIKEVEDEEDFNVEAPPEWNASEIPYFVNMSFPDNGWDAQDYEPGDGLSLSKLEDQEYSSIEDYLKNGNKTLLKRTIVDQFGDFSDRIFSDPLDVLTKKDLIDAIKDVRVKKALLRLTSDGVPKAFINALEITLGINQQDQEKRLQAKVDQLKKQIAVASKNYLTPELNNKINNAKRAIENSKEVLADKSSAAYHAKAKENLRKFQEELASLEKQADGKRPDRFGNITSLENLLYDTTKSLEKVRAKTAEGSNVTGELEELANALGNMEFPSGRIIDNKKRFFETVKTKQSFWDVILEIVWAQGTTEKEMLKKALEKKSNGTVTLVRMTPELLSKFTEVGITQEDLDVAVGNYYAVDIHDPMDYGLYDLITDNWENVFEVKSNTVAEYTPPGEWDSLYPVAVALLLTMPGEDHPLSFDPSSIEDLFY